MNDEQIIRRNIRTYLKKNGNKKVAILPLQNFADIVRRILKEEAGISEQFLVDNYSYDMEHIFPIDQMPEGYEKCTFLVAAFGDTRQKLIRGVRSYVPEKQIVDLLFDKEREAVFQSNSKIRLDFLCPGFAKSGTTSLHYALARNPVLFLPEIKETAFLRYAVNDNTHESFKKHYPPDRTEGKLVGGIEPTYQGVAEDVYQYFGGALKLIFCARNPADALYSRFKMVMRDELTTFGSTPLEGKLMEEFGAVCPEMFDKWTVRYSYMECYSDYIKTYLKYYPMEQMKIMICEELYGNPCGQMDDLQAFLGIAKENRVEYLEMPRENMGTKVAKNREGLEINKAIRRLNAALIQKGDIESAEMLYGISSRVENLTMVNYNEPMLPKTHKRLLDYYMDSIHELESLMGRSLKGIWYH